MQVNINYNYEYYNMKFSLKNLSYISNWWI